MLAKKLSGGNIHRPVLEAVKSKIWRAGSPTVVTYIHKLSRCVCGGGGGQGGAGSGGAVVVVVVVRGGAWERRQRPLSQGGGGGGGDTGPWEWRLLPNDFL